MSLKWIQAFTHYYGHTNNENCFVISKKEMLLASLALPKLTKLGWSVRSHYRTGCTKRRRGRTRRHPQFEIRRHWIVLRLFLRRELLHTVFTSVCRCIIYSCIKCILNQVMLVVVDQCGTLNYCHF